MKRWGWLLVAAGILLAWRTVDAQALGRREGSPNRQPGSVAPQAPAAPDAGTLTLFAAGAAPVVLYTVLKRHRKK